MARIIGIDYGEKKTGLSVTDPLQIIVNVLDVVPTIKLMGYLENYFGTEDVEQIVIGQSFHADGSLTALEKKILGLIDKLNKLYPEIVISRQDEFRTSEEAKEILFRSGLPKKKRSRKGMIDKVSAVLILQKFLKHI